MLESREHIALTDTRRNKYYNTALIITAVLFAVSTFYRVQPL